jgi:predicted Holliday junction resolvase-like endonuclease
MELLLAIVIVVIVGAFVTAPLRRRAGAEVDTTEAELAELEARKQAKYREIRDAEADRASGKLTDEDFQRLDQELRGEAIEILQRIDGLQARARDNDPG